MVFGNFRADTWVAANAAVAQILEAFETWREPQAFLAQFDPARRRIMSGALRRLVAVRLLERRPPAAARADGWEPWDPAAGFFHFSTKGDLAHERSVQEAEAAERRLMELTARGAGARRRPRTIGRTVALPATAPSGEFVTVLTSRRTWREFGPGRISTGELAQLLHLTWGQQRVVSWTGGHPIRLKTSPSPGALHAIEPYVLVRRVEGLASGLYCYDAGTHRLGRVGPAVRRRDLGRYIPNQWWFWDACAVVFMAVAFDRLQARYRFARVYRSALLEAGHGCQTFCLVATWLGLAPFCTMALADTRIESALGIDGERESVVYAAGVGRRPARDWRPWPDHEPGRPLVPPARNTRPG